MELASIAVFAALTIACGIEAHCLARTAEYVERVRDEVRRAAADVHLARRTVVARLRTYSV